jgi:site-specific recombinase XerC
VLRMKAMKAAGIAKWPVDVARHSFATALYKSTDNVNKVMAELGHFGSADTFTRHYKGVPMSKKAAQSYFEIKPSSEANTIMMQGAA